MNSHVIERLPILVLEAHSRCNCRCVMCDIWKTETAEELSVADLERHLGEIRSLGVRWVVFSGGEPLIHSDFFRLCRLLRDNSIRTTILSSGLLVGKLAAEIVRDVDEVIVSLDGPPPVHDQIRGINRASELLAAGVEAVHRLDPAFPVAGRCTVQRLNFRDLRGTVETARRIGLQSISFLAVDLASTAFNRLPAWDNERQVEVGLNRDETLLLEQEIEALIRDYGGDLGGDGFIRETPEKLRRIVRHFQAHRGTAEPVSPRCNAPWVSTVVETDGTVRPCFFHPPIGNLKDGGLMRVLNSPAALRFRSQLDVAQNPVCRRCVCSLYLDDR